MQLRDLPNALSSFVGRDEELAFLRERVPQERLLTLIGPGGVGKTRLSLRVAEEVQARFSHGVTFIPLADLRDPALLLKSIAQSVGVAESADQPVLSRLHAFFGTQQRLLILDNFEQLLSAAPRIGSLLAGAPNLHILVTSRSALQINGEYEYQVPPLAFPPLLELRPGQEPDPAWADLPPIRAYPAVQLFVARVQAVRPAFELTDENEQVVAGICRRLDGLPLALELAAARTRVLSLDALLARMDQALALLTGGSRDAPARQRTLRATIAWSYDLLAEDAQRLMRFFGVFIGGATLTAIKAIGVAAGIDEFAVIDGLEALIAASLLQRVDDESDPRFQMLETVREFSAEQLTLHPADHDLAQETHLHSMRSLVDHVVPDLLGPAQMIAYNRLNLERANLRAALDYAIKQQMIEPALALAGQTWRYWWMRGDILEAKAWLDRALTLVDPATAPDDAAFIRAWAGAERARGIAGWAQADYDTARTYLYAALAHFRRIDDQYGIAHTLHNLGQIAAHLDELDQSEALYLESLAMKRRWNDVTISSTVNNLGYVAERRGDFQLAYERYSESAQMKRELGDTTGMSQQLAHAAEALTRLGRFREARVLLQEALQAVSGVSPLIMKIEVLQCAAELAAAEGFGDRSTRLFAAVEELRRRHGAALPIDEYPRVVPAIKAARDQLGPHLFREVWAEGQQLDVESAIELALAPPEQIPPPERVVPAEPRTQPASSLATLAVLEEPLTTREYEVLMLLCEGLSNRAIAEQLMISAHTVQSHVKSLFAKLNVNTRSAATRVAIELGLVTTGRSS